MSICYIFCCCWQQWILISNQDVAPSEACTKLAKILAAQSVSTLHQFAAVDSSLTIVARTIKLTSYGMMHTMIHSQMLKGIVLCMHCSTPSLSVFAVTHINEVQWSQQIFSYNLSCSVIEGYINPRALLCGLYNHKLLKVLISPCEYAINTIFSWTGSLMLRLASDWVGFCNPSVLRKKPAIACKYLQHRSRYSLFSHNDTSSDLDTEATDEKDIGANCYKDKCFQPVGLPLYTLRTYFSLTLLIESMLWHCPHRTCHIFTPICLYHLNSVSPRAG